uniref:Uncharacterized protein n=1 Tax=Panagrolaimus sp. PS1159 TaxID=55785 RepID=A0AC35FKM9_9BILA
MKLLFVLFIVVSLFAIIVGQGFSQMRRPMMMGRGPFPQRSFILQRGPMGPPRRPLPMSSSNNFDGMPGLRPPKGIAEKLNRAKLKDFMQLGQFLMHRRALQA